MPRRLTSQGCFPIRRISVLTLLLVVLLPSLTLANINPDDKIRIIPSVASIPPPVTYLDKARARLPESHLTCSVWPPNANLSILSARPQLSAHSLSHGFALDPISPASFQLHEYIESNETATGITGVAPPTPDANVAVQLTATDNSDVWRVDSMDLHCKATTQFGTIVSAPFRVVHSRLRDFSMPSAGGMHSTPHGYTNTRVQEFIKGNLAYVTCQLPPDSQPPPTVQFYVNGSMVTPNAKYKQVHRANENQVMLLINSFKTADEGDYRCSVTNPVTGKSVWSPETVRLQVRTPDKPVPVRILLPLAPQDNTSSSASRQFQVREGDNVTLFCIMEGAPPPEVRTYPFVERSDRYIPDDQFGLLHIINVQPSDAATYLCSSTHLISTTTLTVKARLRLTQSPTDVRVSSLGSRAEFRCSSSDPTVKPFWLFNGEPRYTPTPNILAIDSVRESDLGIYQCIVRSQLPDGRTDEWVSASAILSLRSDKLITKAADLEGMIPAHTRRNLAMEPFTGEMTPRAEMVPDNFAVYLAWDVSDQTLAQGFSPLSGGGGGGGSPGHMMWNDHNFQAMQPAIQTSPPAFLIEYSTLINQPVMNPALIGLVPPEPAEWTKPEQINKRWKSKYGFVIGHPMKPGQTYRFRIRAVSPETGEDLVPASGWSELVDTHHISEASPPKILSVQPYPDERFNVTWEFDGAQSMDYFKPDFFLILVRPVLNNRKKDVDASEQALATVGETSDDNIVRYGRYRATQVNGSESREGFVHNLNASVSYQLVVYGVKIVNGTRRITRFSEPVFATLPEMGGFGTFSLIRAVTENKPIVIGLGALAIFIFIVILILVIMCISRSRRDRYRPGVKQNGFVYGASVTEKYASEQAQGQASSTSHTRDDLHTSSPSVKGNQGQSMMMGTLMRQSNFSESDAQKLQFAQAQAQQQQQAAIMGSMMHLGGAGYYAQHPHHHQSHHSLLMSPGAGVAPSPMMFHSGTLPGGPARAYAMRGHPPPPPPFGSQHVLSTGSVAGDHPGGGDQASLMRDYYNQQQQQLYQQTLQQQVMGQPQQPPFMYATNNPGLYLPPQHPSDTMSRRQNQSAYTYGAGGGSIHSAASLKRDGADGTIDGNLLARSPMSPQLQQQQMMMMEAAAGSSAAPPAYFHGSQQALHQPGGFPMSPSQQMSLYQQHQVAAAAAQQQAMMMGSPQFYPGHPPPPDPSLMRHHSLGHDGDSIYSYFSQQDVCHPQPHALLNTLPEENQMGYTAESGSQTAGGMNGGGTLTGGSPAPGGSHRHHRRRRRKPQPGGAGGGQQQQQLGSGEDAGEMPQSGGEMMVDQSGNFQYSEQQQYPGYGDNQHHQMMSMMEGQAPPQGFVQMANGTPPSAAGLEQNGTGTGNGSGEAQIDNIRSSANHSFDLSTPSYGASPAPNVRAVGGALPPPSQPPPPPPAPQMGHHPSQGYFQPPQMADNSSLNRRGMGSLSGSGLLAGPPPRIRDYSEYGIPSGIPSTTAGSGAEQIQPKPGMMMAMTAPPANRPQQLPPAYNGAGTPGRYREGQA